MTSQYDATYRSLYFEYPRFASPFPAELAGDASRDEVVLVGGGPVGLATAIDLAERGVRVVLLEAETTIGIGSRAGSLSRYSVEYLASLGIGDQLLAQGMVYDAGWTYFRDREVFRLSIPGRPGDQFPPMLKIQQCYIERYLADRANAHPGIDLRWGHRLEALRNGADDVELDVSSAHGSYTLRAQYAVGADGARSVVRKQMGQSLEGRTFDSAFVVADVKMDLDLPVGRRMWFDPPWNPGGTVIMHLQPEGIWRFDYSLPPGADEAEELRPEAVARRLADHLSWLGWDAPWELDWMTLYRAHIRIVDRMRVGRTILVGDAAHLIPIFGVRGLNGGLSGAANLSWKLARVVKGQSPETLLDSYDTEQHLVFDGNVAAAELSTRFICPPNAAARTLRDAVLHLAEGHEAFRPLLDPRQSQPISLAGSALVVDPEAGLPPQPGAVLPNLRLGGAEEPAPFVNDLLGRQFTLLRVTSGEELTVVQRSERIEDDEVTVLDVAVPGGSGGPAEEIRGLAVLVRPDRYIAAAWPVDAVVDIGALLARAAGRVATVAGVVA